MKPILFVSTFLGQEVLCERVVVDVTPKKENSMFEQDMMENLEAMRKVVQNQLKLVDFAKMAELMANDFQMTKKSENLVDQAMELECVLNSISEIKSSVKSLKKLEKKFEILV